MKWLMDFLLVRGVNHFVPHAFDDQFPDSDCPPHFYANGQNPQFSGFTQLMHYVNRAAHLLSGADMEASGRNPLSCGSRMDGCGRNADAETGESLL